MDDLTISAMQQMQAEPSKILRPLGRTIPSAGQPSAVAPSRGRGGGADH